MLNKKKKSIEKLILQLENKDSNLKIWYSNSKLVLIDVYGENHKIMNEFEAIYKTVRKRNFGETSNILLNIKNEALMKDEFRQFLNANLENKIKSKNFRNNFEIIIDFLKSIKWLNFVKFLM